MPTSYAFTSFRPPKDPFKWNQYGFYFGGPVWIPKLFNGRNRLFFSSNFEGFRDRKQLRMIASVPANQMRSGDFSILQGRIYDPLTRTGTPGSITAQVFPGNVIPQSRIHSVSTKLLEFLPEPNQSGSSLVSNYQAGRNRLIGRDQFNQRIDFVENSSSSWFGRYSWGNDGQVLPGLKLSGLQILNHPWQAMITNTRVISPSAVNEFRFGATRFTSD